MFSDPYAKLCLMAHLASQFEKVTYIDLDTTFTAYFNAGLVKANHIDIYLPSEGRLTYMIADALESLEKSSLVVFDSVNSFYNLFKAQDRTGDLNHLLSVLLMLLVRRGVDEQIPVLATSMLRYRKERGWVQSPASRRLLQQKSTVIFNVDLADNDLEVTIVQHDLMPPGTKMTYKDCLVTI